MSVGEMASVSKPAVLCQLTQGSVKVCYGLARQLIPLVKVETLGDDNSSRLEVLLQNCREFLQ